MERLILPLLLLVIPLLVMAALYRFWQSITKRLIFKNKTIAAFYKAFITIVMAGFIYMGYSFYQCVWPNHCGEGFASGFVAAGVILGVVKISIVFIVTEIVLFFSVRKIT